MLEQASRSRRDADRTGKFGIAESAGGTSDQLACALFRRIVIICLKVEFVRTFKFPALPTGTLSTSRSFTWLMSASEHVI